MPTGSSPRCSPKATKPRVGQGGNRLSGGQRQRIALARAILRDPDILILDEATSQIDVESERLIHQVLEEFTRGRTAFIITHRPSTLELADRIVVMEAGRVRRRRHVPRTGRPVPDVPPPGPPRLPRSGVTVDRRLREMTQSTGASRRDFLRGAIITTVLTSFPQPVGLSFPGPLAILKAWPGSPQVPGRSSSSDRSAAFLNGVAAALRA